MWAYVTGLVLIFVVSVSAGDERIQTGEIDCGSSDSWAKVEPHDSSKASARENAQIVTFKKKYCSPPTVFLALSYLDVPHDKDVRYNTILNSVSSSDFNASCYTWDDSIVHGMKVRWIAVEN
ncbi:hypothetical protein BsWGS_20526 [Bradybaena similaris]